MGVKVCPECNFSFNEKVTACKYCGYEEKPLSELSEKRLSQIMEPYRYEKTEDGGVRINGVHDNRDIRLRFSVGVPNFVTEIGEDAFAHCKFIDELDLPDGLRAIGDRAFSYCKGLTHLHIPEGVTRVGKAIFEESLNMEGVYCAAYDKPEGWDGEWMGECTAWVQWNY